MKVLLIIGIIAAFLFYKQRKERQHLENLEKTNVKDLNPYEDAKMRYFYECALRTLKKKWPETVSFDIVAGHFNANTHSSQIGFKAYLKDGSTHRCLLDFGDICFREIADEEELKKFVKDAMYQTLMKICSEIMFKVEKSKLNNECGVDYDLSSYELDDEQIAKLQELLLDEGIMSIIDENNNQLLKIVVVNDSVA